MHVNIGTLLPRHAIYRPQKTAVIFKEQQFTYFQFNQRVNRIANVLVNLGLQKGDKLATILPNCLEQLELFWAVAKLGVVVVPLSPMLRGTGLSRLLNDSDSVGVVTNADFAPELDKIRQDLLNIPSNRFILIDGKLAGYTNYHELTAVSPQTEPPTTAVHEEDPYNIIYSSGTTGLPKGIVHTHAIRAAYCTSFATAYRITPESVILHTGSLVFNGAFLTLMPAMFQGCKYILHPYFDAQALIETVAQEKVTHIMMVPSQIIAMMHAPKLSTS